MTFRDSHKRMIRSINPILTAGLVALGLSASAQQLDRTKLPADGPAPVIKIAQPETFTLPNGLKVFVVQNNKLPRVAFNLTLDYLPIREGEKAGYVDIAGQLLKTGTKTRTKDQIDEAVDAIGATLDTSPTGVYALSLKKHTPKLLELMSDIILNANFTQPELDKLKKQAKSGLASQKDNPNAIAARITSMTVYGKDHPYGEQDSEETVDRITLDDCRKFYQTYYRPNIGYLAVVGDITPAEARSMVEKYLGKWQRGDVPKPTYEMPKDPEKTKVVIVDRPSAVQSMINISYPVELKPYSQESIRANLTNDILGGSEARLFNNLREKRGYTYGAYSALSSDRLVGRFRAYASTRNAVTDSAVAEFMNELKAMRTSKPTADELNRTKSAVAGNFVFSLEDPQTIANFAINTARYNLPADFFANYLKNVDAVTDADVEATAAKFIRPEHAYIVVVGKASEIADKLKPFGEIEYTDVNGNRVAALSTAKALPAGLTAEGVLDKYFAAIGGKDAVAKITDVTYKMTGEIQGQTLTIESRQKAPNKYAMSVMAMGQEVQKMVSDGTKLQMGGMGGQRMVEGDEAKLQMLQSGLFPELKLAATGAKATLAGTEKVNGKDAYKVDISLPSGQKFSEYFDAQTGLKTQVSITQKNPQNGEEMTVNTGLDDYRAVNGVKFPYVRTQSFGPMQLKLQTQSVQVNTGVADNVFTIQ